MTREEVIAKIARRRGRGWRLFRRVDVWRPRYGPTRFGVHHTDDYRLVSLRWLMVRVWGAPISRAARGGEES